MRLILAAAAVLAAAPAIAGQAQCYNSDEGYYDCWFEPGSGGDFAIDADGFTTYVVDVTEPGVAWVQAVFPGTSDFVNLPGPYYRSGDDGACWVNPDTTAEICAW